MESRETSENNASRCNGFSSPLNQPFQLAQWQVLPDRNKIRHLQEQHQRSIEPRLMQLLCFLAANSLTVVDRDALVQQLWPNVIVNENSLTRAVSELRKQLRGGCDKNTIETIPKRGYRLSQTIGLNNDNSLASPKSIPSDLPSPFLANAITASAAALRLPRLPLLALGFGVFLASFISNDSGSLKVDSAFNSVLIADEVLMSEPDFLGGELALSSAEPSFSPKASISDPIVSHDGGNFAYVSYDQSGSTIYVGTLNQMGDPYPIYHDAEKLVNLSWSPLGQSLLFTKKPNLKAAALFERKANNELLVLDVMTGNLRRLVEDRLPDKGDHTVNANSLT